MSWSSATVRVEKATSDLLIGPDWTMNIDICDSINSAHWQAKDVVKAVKKRLQHKNPKVQLLALTLLETMIKNCGDYVHLQVVERNILQEMIKIVRKKTDMHVRDKILVLLDSWQAAFGGPGGKYPQYYWAYDELRRSGVEFPQRPADAAIIFSPPATNPMARHFQAGYGMPSGTTRRLDEAMASEMESLSLSNLDSIRSVMELLTDMLQAVNPNDREAVKDEVIVDLVGQCHANQKKLMQLVTSTGDEELLAQGLALNDNLQSLLAKHEAIASGSPFPTEAIDSSPRPNPAAAAVATPSGQLEEDEDEEDDDFAQLARRCSKTKPVPPQSRSTETADPSASSTITTTTTTGSPTASTSTVSSALALPDPPTPVKISTKEQDMIDLLSITLSTTNSSSPHTPLTPPNASNLSPNQIPVSPNAQIYPPYSPQSYPINQGQMPYNSYVVPWAQPQLQLQPQQQMPQYSSSYPPPPWAGPTNSNQVPLSATPYPYQTTQANSSNPYRPPARPMQHYNSFGSRGNNVGEAQVSSNSNAGPSTGQKPFVPSYRLFEDLIDLRNADGGLKTSSPSASMSGSSGQGMVGGRK